MEPLTFTARTELPVSARAAFDWHARPGALRRLIPPWEDVSVESTTGGIRDGDRVVLRIGLGPGGLAGVRWTAEHRDFVDGERFRDVQVDGPFRYWEHTHRFSPVEDHPDRCVLEDAVRFLPPLGAAGRALGGPVVQGKLAAMFAYRHDVTRHDLADHARFADRPRMRVLLSGAGGLIGSRLAAFLTTGGHTVVPLTRSPSNPDEIGWSPADGRIDADRLDGFDAVVHLAGEPVQGRWTAAKKRRILNSRADGTRLLCDALAAVPNKPRVLVSASATGYYGDRGDEELTADSPPGGGFLPDVCRAWEAACDPARDAGIRVAHPRIGIVLSPAGGALANMLPVFKLGGGGRIGDGTQWWAWVGPDDVLGAIHHALMDDTLAGPLNLTAPHPVTCADFAATLGRVLHRPAFVPAPAFAVRLAFGEMADGLLLASARAVPRVPDGHGYRFRHPTLGAVLRHQLGRVRVTP